MSVRIGLLAYVFVLEKYLKKKVKLQLQEHVAKVQPLLPYQHGLCCGRSTTSTVLNFLSCDAVIADFIN